MLTLTSLQLLKLDLENDDNNVSTSSINLLEGDEDGGDVSAH